MSQILAKVTLFPGSCHPCEGVLHPGKYIDKIRCLGSANAESTARFAGLPDNA